MNTAQTRTYSRIALFAALIAAGSYISIPIPGSPVPVVLANLFVVLAGMVLGPWNGMLSAGVYLLIGTAGLPVFSAGSGGPAHLVGPTGGYLVGYLVAAMVTGLTIKALRPDGDRKYRAISSGILAALAGLATVYIPGALWLANVLELSPTAAIATGVVPYIPGDILKAAAAGLVLPALIRSGLISGGRRTRSPEDADRATAPERPRSEDDPENTR
ncbi:MAG: biotin transporter BioY [Spirochaetia bacterium]